MDIPTSLRDQIRRIGALHGGANIRVFGSCARGQDGPESDLDILVDLAPDRSLLDLIAIKQDLEDLLGRPVDVATERALNPYLRESILKDAVPL